MDSGEEDGVKDMRGKNHGISVELNIYNPTCAE
jgi:hypothetical protein